MDVVCTKCGEPWDLDHVLHEEPENFDRQGALIKSCPCCQGEQVKLSKEEKERLAIIQEIAWIFGDDIDGFAAELEDLGVI